MSLLSKIGNVAKGIIKSPIAARLAPVLGGPVGATIGALSTAYSAYQMLKPAVSPSMASMPGTGLAPLTSMGMGMLSPGTIAGAGRVIATGASRAAKGAVSLCRKYPQWCSTIGGTAAVEAMIHSGQIPAPKHRRGRGITAHELKAFKRVARFTSKYCAPVHRAMRAPAVRGGKSCR